MYLQTEDFDEVFNSRYYAGYAGKIGGDSFPPDEDGMYKIVQYSPLGVCAGIPIATMAH